jgi:hypothetical protein
MTITFEHKGCKIEIRSSTAYGNFLLFEIYIDGERWSSAGTPEMAEAMARLHFEDLNWYGTLASDIAYRATLTRKSVAELVADEMARLEARERAKIETEKRLAELRSRSMRKQR